MDGTHGLDGLLEAGRIEKTDERFALIDDRQLLDASGFPRRVADSEQVIVIDLQKGRERGGLAGVDPTDDSEGRKAHRAPPS